jgi:hypothetical protein
MLTYKQAYDKIIEAYFRDEIEPLLPTFCFCGTLNENNPKYWTGFECKNDGVHYVGRELQKMEVALLSTMEDVLKIPYKSQLSENWKEFLSYENALFAGMSAALDVLKEIHRARGEDVDGEFQPFVKRQLTPA